MAQVRSNRRKGALAFYESHRHRLVDAVGDNVVKFELLQPEPTDDTTGDPTRFTATMVEAGAGGDSTVVNSTTAGIAGGGLLFTTDNAENDGINLQAKGEAFGLHANNEIYFGARLEINDADQTDIFIGLAITDTTLLGGVSDAIYFESLDESAALAAVTEKDGTETTTAAVATLADDTEVFLEFYVDGTSTVYFYVNGTRVATHTANLPDDEELTPSVHFLTGEAIANTMQLKDMKVIQIGRNETA